MVIKSIKAFIDDVAMSASKTTSSIQALKNEAQHQLRWWNDLIKVTGGELNPSKCCGTIAAWQPDKFGILCPVYHGPNEIKITLSEMDPQQIPKLQ